MAPVRRSEPKTSVHSSKGRFEVMTIEPRRSVAASVRRRRAACRHQAFRERLALSVMPSGDGVMRLAPHCLARFRH